IKSFRAVTARATFLCLCKETWRKESTPRLRARCVAPGSRSRRDFPRRHPASAENAAHPCAAPCGSGPPAPPLRRGPEIKIKIKINGNGNGKRHLRGLAVGRGYAPDLLFAATRRAAPGAPPERAPKIQRKGRPRGNGGSRETFTITAMPTRPGCRYP